jgi:hypothetical protein
VFTPSRPAQKAACRSIAGAMSASTVPMDRAGRSDRQHRSLLRLHHPTSRIRAARGRGHHRPRRKPIGVFEVESRLARDFCLTSSSALVARQRMSRRGEPVTGYDGTKGPPPRGCGGVSGDEVPTLRRWWAATVGVCRSHDRSASSSSIPGAIGARWRVPDQDGQHLGVGCNEVDPSARAGKPSAIGPAQDRPLRLRRVSRPPAETASTILQTNLKSRRARMVMERMSLRVCTGDVNGWLGDEHCHAYQASLRCASTVRSANSLEVGCKVSVTHRS